MKIKTVSVSRFTLLCTALVVAWFMLSDKASAVSIRDARQFGLVQVGPSSRHSDGSSYVDNLISIALRSNERASEQYFRSVNPRPPVLSDPVSRHAPSVRGNITVPSPGGGPTGVPDGGITAMLLGAALGALGIARRYLRT